MSKPNDCDRCGGELVDPDTVWTPQARECGDCDGAGVSRS
jgi:DnaJ-class molecular chaperone